MAAKSTLVNVTTTARQCGRGLTDKSSLNLNTTLRYSFTKINWPSSKPSFGSETHKHTLNYADFPKMKD